MRVDKEALFSPEGANLRRGSPLLPQGVSRPNAGLRGLIQWVLIALRPRREPCALWTGPQIEENIPRGQKLKKKQKQDFIIGFGPSLLY
jgi:hypothetical protein